MSKNHQKIDMHKAYVDVRRYYERFGFAYIAKSNYLYIKL